MKRHVHSGVSRRVAGGDPALLTLSVAERPLSFPRSATQGAMMNLLVNPSFDGAISHYKGNPEVDVPAGWDVGWLDNKYGPRRREGVVKCYKPEVRRIELVPPHDDPPRVAPDSIASLHGYKSWGTLCWWVYQKIIASPGKAYCFGAVAHAWAHESGDPDAGHYTHGIGTAGYYATEDVPGLSDDAINYRFRVGIDPFGGSDPFGSAVVWGLGAYIYNVFHSIPLVEAMARADYITVFLMIDNLWGFENSDAYIDNAELVAIDAPPPVECRGLPRVQYARKYHVIPATTTPQRLAEIRAIVPFTDTMGTSYDDAGVGDLDDKTAVLWDKPPDQHTQFVDWYQEWYPGTRVEFVNEEQPPIPPPIEYVRPTSMGGLHIASGPRTGYGDFLRNCQRSIALQSLEDFGALLEAKGINSRTVTIARVWPAGYEGDDTPPGNWQWAASQSKSVATNWMARIYPKLDANTFKPDWVGFVNEPDPADYDSMLRANEFMLYCMEDADAHGVKLAIWAWTAGLPRTPRISATDFPQAEMSLTSLQYAAEHGHCLSIHDGSVNGDRRLLRQAYEDQTALRYRVYKTLMDEKGWPMPPIVITECYQGDMRNNPDWGDWAWYLGELAKDPYMLGCCVFTVGDYGEQNISGQLPEFADLLAALPVVA